MPSQRLRFRAAAVTSRLPLDFSGVPEVGRSLDRDTFLQKHKDIAIQLNARQSIRNAAKIRGRGASTVQRVKLALGT